MTYPHNEYDDAEVERREAEWAKAKQQAKDDQLNRVPDGAYQVVVDRALIKSTQDGRPMLSLGLKILGPDHAGRYLWHNRLLDNEAIWPWLAKDLEKLGVDVPHPSMANIEPKLDVMLDRKLDVTVKTKGEYQNIYVNSRIDVSDVPF